MALGGLIGGSVGSWLDDKVEDPIGDTWNRNVGDIANIVELTPGVGSVGGDILRGRNPFGDRGSLNSFENYARRGGLTHIGKWFQGSEDQARWEQGQNKLREDTARGVVDQQKRRSTIAEEMKRFLAERARQRAMASSMAGTRDLSMTGSLGLLGGPLGGGKTLLGR